MRLRQPTDFLILESLHIYGRNVATNLAETTGKSRKNVNNRLPVLADYGLVRKVGPAERSGLYEITETGRVAVELSDEYDDTDDFEALIERRLEAAGGQPVAVTARGESGDADAEHEDPD